MMGCMNRYEIFTRNLGNLIVIDFLLNNKEIMVKINDEQYLINQDKLQTIQDIILFFHGMLILS